MKLVLLGLTSLYSPANFTKGKNPVNKVLIVPLEDFLGNFGIIGNLCNDSYFSYKSQFISEVMTEYKKKGWTIIGYGKSNNKENRADRIFKDSNPYQEILEKLPFLQAITIYYYRSNISIWLDRKNLLEQSNSTNRNSTIVITQTETEDIYYSFGYSLIDYSRQFITDNISIAKKRMAVIYKDTNQCNFFESRNIYCITTNFFVGFFEKTLSRTTEATLRCEDQRFLNNKEHPNEPIVF